MQTQSTDFSESLVILVGEISGPLCYSRNESHMILVLLLLSSNLSFKTKNMRVLFSIVPIKIPVNIIKLSSKFALDSRYTPFIFYFEKSSLTY